MQNNHSFDFLSGQDPLNTDIKEQPEQINLNAVWDGRIDFPKETSEKLMQLFRDYGMPLANGIEVDDNNENENDSTASSLCCLVSIIDKKITGIIASPSGIVKQYHDDKKDDYFWPFVMRHHYVVTGNRTDRAVLEELTNTPIKKGKSLMRLKTDVESGLTINHLIKMIETEVLELKKINSSAPKRKRHIF